MPAPRAASLKMPPDWSDGPESTSTATNKPPMSVGLLPGRSDATWPRRCRTRGGRRGRQCQTCLANIRSLGQRRLDGRPVAGMHDLRPRCPWSDNDQAHARMRSCAQLSGQTQQCTSECDDGDDDGGGTSKDDRAGSDLAESGELHAGPEGEHRRSEKHGLRDLR